MNQREAFDAAAKKAGWAGSENMLWAIARGAYVPKSEKARAVAEKAISACAAMCPGWANPGNSCRKAGVPSRG
jgi:hypothetical protein